MPFLKRGDKPGGGLGIICSGMLALSKWEGLGWLIAFCHFFTTLPYLSCVSWKRKASGPWWTILALTEHSLLFVFLLHLPGSHCHLCHRVGMARGCGGGRGGRERKNYQGPQRLYSAPFPSLPGISEDSETASTMVETAPQPAQQQVYIPSCCF